MKKSVSFKKILKNRETTIFLILIGMVIVSSIVSPSFRSINNIANIFNQNAFYGIMAIGMAYVLIAGGMDLSIGATAALSGMVSALVIRDVNIWLGILAAIAVGVIVGLINGLVVVYIKLPPFIVTLGTMYIARGISCVLTNAHPVNGFPSWVNQIGIGKWHGIPIAASIWIILAIIMQIVLNFTKFGQYVFALGGNENAAWLSGINIKKMRIMTYIINGVFASCAALIIIFRLMIATADACSGYEMIAIAACVIGGISMSGGRGGVIGTIFGTLIYGLILNMLQLIGVSSYWQQAVTGFIIIAVTSIDSLTNARKR